MEKRLDLNNLFSIWALFLACSIATTLNAQRLNIELKEKETEFPKILYGRILEEKLYIFEKVQNLKKTSVSALASEQVIAPKADKRVRSFFDFQELDRKNCTETVRYKEFLQLLKILANRISSLTLKLPKSWESCETALNESLKSFEVPINREIVDESLKRIEVEMFGKNSEAPAAVTESAEPAQGVTQIAAPTITAKSVSPSKPVLKINGEQISINESGFFIFIAKNSDWLNLSLKLDGYEFFETKEKPIVVGINATKISSSKMYSERLVFFARPVTSIAVGPLVQLDNNTVVDLGLGLGFGYGRQIPGDERGKRILGRFGAEYRRILGDVGVKAGLSYTNASDSVVPYTIAGEALLVYDTAVFNDKFITRFGLGAQFLKTKIKKQENANAQMVEPVFIPEEVLAPLTLISFHSVFYDYITASLNLYYAPLYVANFGFYPSFSPSFEFGYKFSKSYILSLVSGTDSYKYPTATTSTKLQIDYTSLSLKIGL